MTTLKDIKLAVSEGKKIVTYRLIFVSFFNQSTKQMEYRMNDEYNVDKWEIYQTENEYIKAIMQRVNYYIRRGFPNVIEIK